MLKMGSNISKTGVSREKSQTTKSQTTNDKLKTNNSSQEVRFLAGS
jgi:hypothetical protein